MFMLIRVEYPENGLYTCISPEVRKGAGLKRLLTTKILLKQSVRTCIN
jgi:hypothetical protein